MEYLDFKEHIPGATVEILFGKYKGKTGTITDRFGRDVFRYYATVKFDRITRDYHCKNLKVIK